MSKEFLDSTFIPLNECKECVEGKGVVLFLLLFLTGEPVEFALEQKRVASQAEGTVQLLQQVNQTGKKGNMK